MDEDADKSEELELGSSGGLVRAASLTRMDSSPSKRPRIEAIRGSVPPKGMTLPFGAVIHFAVHSLRPSVMQPWKVSDPRRSTGTGFHIGDNRILTNAHVVRFGASIRLERHGQPGNFAGRVLCQSELCDLALVTVDDELFWEGLPAVAFQDSVPSLDDNVVAVGYPCGAKSVTVTRGVVSNVALKHLSLSNTGEPQLAIQIDAAINPGNSGGPVFNAGTGAVVGVAFAGQDKAQNVGLIIPVPVVRLFIGIFEKTGNENFGLLPSIGIDVDKLVNPKMRAWCFGGQKPQHFNGALITSVSKHSASEGKLQVGDILLKLDGVDVSENCDVIFRGQERLPWRYLVTQKPLGASVQVTVLRKAESGTPSECTIEIILTALPRLLPSILGIDYHLSYVIVGGLVFLPAGYPLLEAARKSKKMLVYGTIASLPLTSDFEAPDQQICILTDVLSHALNVSYDRLVGEALDMVNGTKVRNMRHLVSLVSAVEEGDLTLDFKAAKSTCKARSFCMFNAREALETRDEILKMNKIPNWCAPELVGKDWRSFTGTSV